MIGKKHSGEKLMKIQRPTNKKNHFDIVTFGGAVIDTFLNTDVPEDSGKICYESGSKILIKDLRFDVGGGGTNTAAAFSRFGFKTGFIGKLGKAANAHKVLDCLKNEKITFLGTQDPKFMTGYSVILDSREHERTILTYKGANDHVKLSDIKPFTSDWLYLSSLLEESFTTQITLAKKLYKQGTRIAFNPSQYLITNHNLSPLLTICDVLILNKEEAQLLTKNNSDDIKVLFKSIHDMHPKKVVITDTMRPAGVYDGSNYEFITPHKNVKVVERTGAGDAFASGFVAGCMAKKPLKYCMDLALRESESVLKYFGAKNNLLKMKLRK